MKFDDILFATQYYRSPTPLEDEWDLDLSNMSKYDLNTIQIRINWRNNERKENEYCFDDVDKLIELAKKHNKKVIIKFLLECAPQYVFDKYNGYRIGPKGEKLRGGSHGAFYAGGWLPCFQNEKVKERAIKFVKEVVKRYYKEDCIILWNAWNEPRNKPIEECFCDECRKGFGNYQKDKFSTIENLNKYYGVAEESFENIALPAMPHGYWDIFEFKKFKSEQGIYNNLRFVYDAIRSIDKDRPVISHSGYPSAFQTHLGDCLSDNYVSKAVDMWGTSVPCDTNMNVEANRFDFNMLNDYLYSISKDYFLYEIYPGLGMYNYTYDTVWDMKYKLYLALSKGAKGLNFWQYRSERVGHENDCAGLARMDGSPREVLDAVKEVGDFVENVGKDLVNYYKPQSEVAILFDYDSCLMSEIEDCSGTDYAFNQYWNILYYFKSHSGFYRFAKRNNINIDYVQTANIKDIEKYKLVYIPYYAMIKPEVMETIKEFVNNGGVVIADEGFGLRDQNTWVNPYDLKVNGLFKGRIRERRYSSSKVDLCGKTCEFSGYKSILNIENSKVLAKFDDNSPAIQCVEFGKGKFIYSGVSIGYNLYAGDTYFSSALKNYLISKCNISTNIYSSFADGIECNEMIGKDCKTSYLFFLNNSKKAHSIIIKENIEKCLLGEIKDQKITLKGNGFVIVKIRY